MLPAGLEAGLDPAADRKRFHVTAERHHLDHAGDAGAGRAPSPVIVPAWAACGGYNRRLIPVCMNRTGYGARRHGAGNRGRSRDLRAKRHASARARLLGRYRRAAKSNHVVPGRPGYPDRRGDRGRRLSLAELTLIDHIFVTHSHLDHVNSIAFFLDSVGALRPKPVTVYATAPTIETLKKHLFNWDIWPDFTADPHARTAVAALRGGRGGKGDRSRGTQDHGAAGDTHGARPSAICSTAARAAWSSPATPGRTTRCGPW